MPTQTMPDQIYQADDAARIDRYVIETLGVPGYRLMVRAAQAAFDVLHYRFPNANKMVVLAGGGNNAGDGYALADIAHRAGWQVTVVALVPPERLKNEAGQAVADAIAAGVACCAWSSAEEVPPADVYVDALFGIGLGRPIESGDFADAVDCLNAQGAPVLSLDVPSGLSADTGQVLGKAVQASLTITFIVVKRGLLTGLGPDVAGELWFDDLGGSAECAAKVAQGIDQLNYHNVPKLPRRQKASHKGTFGDVLIVGGDHGMAGAAVLAAEAALCGGAGRVTLVTRPAHLTAALMRCPEVLSAAVEQAQAAKTVLAPLLSRAQVVVLGPGLGAAPWGRALMEAVLSKMADHDSLRLVLDADALNLIAQGALPWPAAIGDRVIMTPHPREAARLLGALPSVNQTGSVERVQADRFAAAKALSDGYGAHIVLKGVGTVLAHPAGASADESQSGASFSGLSRLAVCTLGNPGMAVAGMGDVLSGVLGAVLAQGLAPAEAARLGVTVHAAAGDWVRAERQAVCVRPTEIIPVMQRLLGNGLDYS